DRARVERVADDPRGDPQLQDLRHLRDQRSYRQASGRGRARRQAGTGIRMSPPSQRPHSGSAGRRKLRAAEAPRVGVRIAGTGSFLPDDRLTNDELTLVMDTSDEWIR